MTKRKASVALDSISDGNPANGHSGGNDNANGAISDLPDNGGSSNTGVSGIISNQDGTTSAMTVINKLDLGSNQNDNSIGSNCSGNNSSIGGAQSQKSKKERSDNWSSAEIQVLHKGIESRRDIFYGPPSQATKKNRELAWEAITREVNAVSTTPRNLGQVMKKFKNEKCRAKRKFAEPDKESNSNHSSGNQTNTNHSSSTNSGNNNNLSSNNNVSNSSHGDSTNTTATNDTTPNTSLSAQNHANAGQHQCQLQQQQTHHMTSTDQSMAVHQPSINVVKLAPQNVAKTMIDLPGHVQQIQMPNDDMVLIVPPDMDGILSGVNIVSDGNGHHHFQKCSSSNALNSHLQNHHNQHSLQALNTNQTLVNGTMSNGMMARTISGPGMCSLVYSTGNEVCAPEHHVTQSVSAQSSLTPHHLSVNPQNLTHHRGNVDQSQVQQSHHHQIHHQPQHQPHQHQQQHQQQQQLLQPQHLPHPTPLSTHNQQHLPQNHLPASNAITNSGGIAVESQLKNLLFNLLLKDGQPPSAPMIVPNNQDNKHRNDMLAIIASSLSKIEGHLSKISKVATSLATQNMNGSTLQDGGGLASSNQINNSGSSGLSMGGSDGNNNNVGLPNASASMQNSRRDNDRQ